MESLAKRKGKSGKLIYFEEMRVTDNEDSKKSSNLNIIGISRHLNSEKKKILKQHFFFPKEKLKKGITEFEAYKSTLGDDTDN